MPFGPHLRSREETGFKLEKSCLVSLEQFQWKAQVEHFLFGTKGTTMKRGWGCKEFSQTNFVKGRTPFMGFTDVISTAMTVTSHKTDVTPSKKSKSLAREERTPMILDTTSNPRV